MPTTRPLRTSAGCTLHSAGQEWDAVRVPRSIGLAAVQILGTRCGAVVEDSHSAALYYFVTPGSAAAWDADNVRVLGDGATVTIPPARRTQGPGPHWRVCPGDSNWLTDAAALRAAIEDAFGPRFGEEPSA
ncbi:hypothetical protein ACFYQQ_01320 [Streptomyces sp. NPDC005496]|uniref:hypothetical protein n=1 Tax=unclassified Streptomyces TaxID=2593676 RepID=UPI0033A63E2B